MVSVKGSAKIEDFDVKAPAGSLVLGMALATASFIGCQASLSRNPGCPVRLDSTGSCSHAR